ncbi:MAG TPA: hypothetical protein VGD06_02240, partial [Acidobacteriota bacterium]
MSNILWIAGALFLIAVVAGYLWLRSVKRRLAKAREEDQRRREQRLENLPSIPLSERHDDAIYQWSFHHGDRLVARTVKAEVD